MIITEGRTGFLGEYQEFSSGHLKFENFNRRPGGNCQGSWKASYESKGWEDLQIMEERMIMLYAANMLST